MKDESTAARAARQAVWARHWASGAAHSCAGSYEQTYGGAIGIYWRDLHASTPDGARVLDIATGSGALPRLLLLSPPDRRLQIDAVDLAPVAPDWHRGLQPAQAERLRFHAEVAAEALPFPDSHFDLVVSQYGLEYADLDRAVPELLRVRAPAGRIGLVLHHSASRPVTLAAVEMAHMDWLRGPDGLLPAALEMLGPMAQAATPAGRAALAGDAAALAARERYNAAQDHLQARAATPDGADVLHEMREATATLFGLAQQQGADAARRAWGRVDQALADAHWRLDELRRCALDADAAQTLQRQLLAQLPHADLQTLQEGPHLMGWALTARP